MNNKFFRIGKKHIGENKKVFIIAEIGINHGGNFKKCMKMIKAAARAGADSVKIQTNEVDESYMQNTVSYKEFKMILDVKNSEIMIEKKYGNFIYKFEEYHIDNGEMIIEKDFEKINFQLLSNSGSPLLTLNYKITFN